LYVYKNDFDENGSPDPILGQYFSIDGKKILKPVHTRDDIMKQLSLLKNKYLTYDDFSKVDFKTLLNINNLEEETLKASTFATSYVENLGNGKFKITKLPESCQIAPINDILIQDLDKDGHLDALLVGNDFTAETHYGRYDGLTGLLLKGDGAGEFAVVPSKNSGFYAPYQSHSLISIKDSNEEEYILVGQNNEKLRVFSIEKGNL